MSSASLDLLSAPKQDCLFSPPHGHTTSHKDFNFGVWWTIKHREICHPSSLQTFVFYLLYRTLSPVWTDLSVSLRGRKADIFLIADFTDSEKRQHFTLSAKHETVDDGCPVILHGWGTGVSATPSGNPESIYNLHNQPLHPALFHRLWMSSSGHLKALWNRSSLTAEQVITTPQGFTADIKHVLPKHIQFKTKEPWGFSALQGGVQSTAGSWEWLGEPVLEPSPPCRAGSQMQQTFLYPGLQTKSCSRDVSDPWKNYVCWLDTFSRTSRMNGGAGGN